MAVEILMPELGESVHEGTVSRWLKKEGDFVKEDEPVVEIMTDKVNTELGAPASGILSKILIPEGGQVEVFKAMGVIEESGQQSTTSEAPKAATEPASKPEIPEAPVGMPPAPAAGDGKRWYTPVVRSIAKELGVNDVELAGIAGSGEGGRVTKKDVEGYIATRGVGGVKPELATSAAIPSAPAPSPSAPAASTPQLKAPIAASTAGPEQELKPLVGLRKMIADAMVRSAAVPTVSTVTQCDVTKMVHFRDRNKDSFLEEHGVKLTYTPFFIKALAETLVEFPIVNASLQPDGQVLFTKGVHMGIAVALGAKGEDGLIVPVIRDCHTKGLIEIAKDLDGIAKSARSNSLKPTDVQGGTFTLTNPGTYGALFGTPMINSPQAGILGAYAISKQPVIIDDMIAIRSIMHLVLTYDHRIIDGLVAGKFLAAVRDRLQEFDFFK
jgi:pyruvate/2-oxoglutarate dehydrogenase complex dihydrolipoamide acyltransferase (E2) component